MLTESVPPDSPPPEHAEAGPHESPPAGAAPGRLRLVDVLRGLGSDRATGTLVLPGTGERVILRDGRVVLVETPRTPAIGDLVVGSGHLDAAAWAVFEKAADAPDAPPGMPVFSWERMCRETTVDAAAQVLTEDPVDADFRPGPGPGWTDSVPAIKPGRLLREVERRKDVLRRLRPVITPRTVIVKTRGGIWEKIQMTGAQWALLVEVQDGVTPLEVAPRIGHGVISATLLSYELIRLGLLRSDRDNDRRRAEPVGPLFL